MVTAPDPYATQVFRGRLMDNATVAACMKAEHKLGYELTILQGIGNASASAGTHKGRAVDLAWWDQAHKLIVMRDIGFAYWPREELVGTWPAHGHGILVFESRGNTKGLSDEAYAQIGKYDRGEDGLAGHGDDPNNYRPDPRAVLSRREYEFIITGGLEAPRPTRITKMRDSMVEAIQDMSEAIQLGKAAKNDRADEAVLDLKACRRIIIARLKEMPKR
jgi:hypothetical protein